jgi:hypothetical protein
MNDTQRHPADAYTVPRRAQRLLSKSDFKLARSCDAKLYFRENGYPDNRDSNPYLALLARGGYMVEALAKTRYPDAITLEYGRDSESDFEETRRALTADSVTIFEGTLLVGRRLARCDIIQKRGNKVRLIEVKSSAFDSDEHKASLADGKFGVFRTTRKPFGVRADWAEYIEDVAYQLLLLEQVLPGANIEPWLVLVDSAKRAKADNVPGFFEIVEDARARLQTARFRGSVEQLAQLDLTTEILVADEVALIREEVERESLRLEALLDAPLAQYSAGTERGACCVQCEFRGDDLAPSGFLDCWGPLAAPRPHMLELFSIGTVKDAAKAPLANSLFKAGKASLFDIPVDILTKADGTIGSTAARQRRQIEWTRKGEVYVDPGLKAAIDSLEGPIHFIDFETSRLALPYHQQMKPYGLVTFQWSVHRYGEAGTLAHREWLNDIDVWPNESFARSLRDAIGDHGSVLTWSHFETSVMKEIVRDLELFGRGDVDLVHWIRDLFERRIVDMHEWVRDLYYHPGMKGRTSIKVVLDALWAVDPVMRAQFAEWTGREPGVADPYHTLPSVEIYGAPQDVHEGTGAMTAYQEMMYGREKHLPETKAKWARLLKQYCQLDTLSMVLIHEHWKRATAA